MVEAGFVGAVEWAEQSRAGNTRLMELRGDQVKSLDREQRRVFLRVCDEMNVGELTVVKSDFELNINGCDFQKLLAYVVSQVHLRFYVVLGVLSAIYEHVVMIQNRT